MARNIFIVDAKQVVISDINPHGLYSTVNGYPKQFDSTSYNDDTDAALRAAKAEYYARLSANYTGSANRVMAIVTLEQANGQQIMRDCIGNFPVIVPEPEEEPEPEPEPEPVEGE